MGCFQNLNTGVFPWKCITFDNELLLSYFQFYLMLNYEPYWLLIDNKSYDDSVKLKRTEMDPFWLVRLDLV